jgi:hypothetical protein
MLTPDDAVVVSGFWRSGTTWLQQVLCRTLGAKAILEPLRYSIREYDEILRSINLPDRSPCYLDPHMPYADVLSEDSALGNYISRALTSAVSGIPIRLPRFKMREQDRRKHSSRILRSAQRVRAACQSQVVAKFTRAHLLLPALDRAFNSPIIHIRRDPRAVVYSFERTNWDWPDALSLTDQLLTPGDGRQALFEPWSSEIREFDQRPPHVRIAAYWALVETHVERSLPEDTVCVSYEDLCEGHVEVLRSWLGREINERALKLESWSSPISSSDGNRDRINGWKQGMSSRKIQEVEGTISTIGADHLFTID